MLMRNAEAEVAAMAEPVEGDPRGFLTPEGSTVYLCIPGDRRAVEKRLEAAVAAWLVHTPAVRQSASSLASHLMRTIEQDGDTD